MENLKKQISTITKDNHSLNLFFILKSLNGEFTIKRADVESERTIPELCQLYCEKLIRSIVENEELSVVNLSCADERINALYKYDYSNFPEELQLINDFEIGEAINLDFFDFNNDDISQLFAFLFYIGSMKNGVLLFKKHYPVTMIKRGTFLLFKRGERLEKFDDTDVFRMNGDFNILKVDNQLYIKDLPVLEKNCGFEELIRGRANAVLELITQKDLVYNMTDLTEASNDISFAKKLAKTFNNSPVIRKEIPNEKIIEFCKTNPGLIKAFKYSSDGTKFILDTKYSQLKFLKLLNDDYLISELTQSYYNSVAKDNITTE